MNLEQLKTILDSVGYPVAYSHFTETENKPLPFPPFITYLVAYSSNMMADNKVYRQVQNVQIELYTDNKNLIAEAKLEQILNENELPFATTEGFINSEKLYQKIYEVRLL